MEIGDKVLIEVEIIGRCLDDRPEKERGYWVKAGRDGQKVTIDLEDIKFIKYTID